MLQLLLAWLHPPSLQSRVESVTIYQVQVSLRTFELAVVDASVAFAVFLRVSAETAAGAAGPLLGSVPRRVALPRPSARQRVLRPALPVIPPQRLETCIILISRFLLIKSSWKVVNKATNLVCLLTWARAEQARREKSARRESFMAAADWAASLAAAGINTAAVGGGGCSTHVQTSHPSKPSRQDGGNQRRQPQLYSLCNCAPNIQIVSHCHLIINSPKMPLNYSFEFTKSFVLQITLFFVPTSIKHRYPASLSPAKKDCLFVL